jgi:hypothetical protein
MKTDGSRPEKYSRGEDERGGFAKKFKPAKFDDDRRGGAKKFKPIKTEAPQAVVEPGRSVEKSLSRLLRKQRRIEAGKFGARTEPEGSESPATTPEIVSERMRSKIKDKVEAAVHKVDQKNAAQTRSQQSGVARRVERSAGEETTSAQDDDNAAGVGQDIDAQEVSGTSKSQQNPVRKRDEQVGEPAIHDEGVGEPIAEESIDSVAESDDAVLERIGALSEGNEASFKTPSLLFGMEGDMPNPNQKFAKDKPPPPYKPKDKEAWQIQKAALREKFGSIKWDPTKRLSPDSLNGIRALHASDPGTYSTEMLAHNFQVSPEAIRRILKSKWRPSEDEARDRLERWERRGARKWEAMAEEGMRPPRRWRAQGIQQRGVAESRLRRRTPRSSRVREPSGPGGVRVHKSMEGVITQKVDRHGRLLSAPATRMTPTVPGGSGGGGGGAEGKSVAAGFMGRIV